MKYFLPSPPKFYNPPDSVSVGRCVAFLGTPGHPYMCSMTTFTFPAVGFIHRWTNLWWSANFAEDIYSECVFEGAKEEINGLVFVGNLVLVVSLLVAIFLVHIAVISGVEAYWLSQARKGRCSLAVSLV